MKKFLIITITILIVIFSYIVFSYQFGLFIDFHPNKEVTTFIKTDNKKIFLNTGNGYEEFKIKGVDMGAGIPNYFATDYAISKETYLRWFKYIKEMGANTIRVYITLSDDFYEAFYEFNKDNPDPLYLLHGVWVNDYVQYSRLNAYDSEFRGTLLSDCETLVDVIHGKKILSLGNDNSTNFYFRDISKWTLGYIVGVEWESPTVAYTNHQRDDKTSYKGKYMYTSSEASPFEVMLAEVGDKMIEYETTKYKTQRLVAFSNWPTTDALDYNDKIKNAFVKIAKVDVEHILTSDKFISGQFASYHIYPYHPDYLFYDEKIKNLKDYKGKNNTYYTYMKMINEHHSMPVVISEFGVPSSRGMARKANVDDRNQGMLDETEQGKYILECYDDILAAGIDNAIIFTWQDEWFKRTWNTMHNISLLRTPFWSDAQTNEQMFGLLTFDPGTKRSISYNDGDTEEWTKDDVVVNKNDIKLSMKYDEKFIYMYINKKNYNNEKIYIPIDTLSTQGSKKVKGYSINFDKDADFLLVIDGKDNSRLLVQDRYNTLDALFGFEVYGTNSYLNPPSKISDNFKQIHLMIETVNIDRIRNLHSRTYETGKLIYGNGNPNSKEFFSISDFYINGDDIEIRIPWELLNFADPSTMKIHDDYYIHYGAEEIKIDKLNIGVGLDNENINMVSFKLKGWDTNATYHERLKKSYYIVQERWAGGDK